MKPIVYVILFVIALIVFKAFYLDEYLAEKRAAETNATETNTTEVKAADTSLSKPVPVLKTSSIYGGEQNVTIKKQKPSYSNMPLEKVGDEIADKIEGKL